jgi:hypothetical protein
MRLSYRLELFGLIVPAVVLGMQPNGMAQSMDFPKETLLSQGFTPNPVELAGQSGGQFPANRVIAQERTPTGLCLGYIDSLPNHVMTLKAFFDYLSVRVDSEQDTTLIVQGPGGIWCSDDDRGHNPGIEGQWQAGTYQIWVGSYFQEQSNDYTLLIESTARAELAGDRYTSEDANSGP